SSTPPTRPPISTSLAEQRWQRGSRGFRLAVGALASDTRLLANRRLLRHCWTEADLRPVSRHGLVPLGPDENDSTAVRCVRNLSMSDKLLAGLKIGVPARTMASSSGFRVRDSENSVESLYTANRLAGFNSARKFGASSKRIFDRVSSRLTCWSAQLPVTAAPTYRDFVQADKRLQDIYHGPVHQSVNLAGLPSIVLPTGLRGHGGLPLAVQDAAEETYPHVAVLSEYLPTQSLFQNRHQHLWLICTPRRMCDSPISRNDSADVSLSRCRSLMAASSVFTTRITMATVANLLSFAEHRRGESLRLEREQTIESFSGRYSASTAPAPHQEQPEEELQSPLTVPVGSYGPVVLQRRSDPPALRRHLPETADQPAKRSHGPGRLRGAGQALCSHCRALEDRAASNLGVGGASAAGGRGFELRQTILQHRLRSLMPTAGKEELTAAAAASAAAAD
uniref:Macro domain-containing protein n=1 Tax=Macrostomum lignano TaxID=282301 RepID=A0A1I8F7F6_9PLAT